MMSLEESFILVQLICYQGKSSCHLSQTKQIVVNIQVTCMFKLQTCNSEFRPIQPSCAIVSDLYKAIIHFQIFPCCKCSSNIKVVLCHNSGGQLTASPGSNTRLSHVGLLMNLVTLMHIFFVNFSSPCRSPNSHIHLSSGADMMC